MLFKTRIKIWFVKALLYKSMCFGAFDIKILLDIFSLTSEIVSISMRDRFVLQIKDKKTCSQKITRTKTPFYYK